MQHFRMSFLVTIVLLGLAAWWGYSIGGAAGAVQAFFLASILAIMEVSLSFDNAVVNASVLRDWDPFWQKLFLTLGIIIAVFGMRLVFPILIVSIATGLGLIDVMSMALNTPEEYSRHLTENHAQVAAFGGSFLLLVFLNFLFDQDKELHWLGWVEEKLGKHGNEGLSTLLTLLAVFGCVALVSAEHKLSVLMAGIGGVAVYLAVSFLSDMLGKEVGDPALGTVVKRGSIGGFLYLEVLDASFSFDGVIGAFAITSDVVIIMLGLAIGAMFVRSMTVFLVHQGTLEEFVFLEHGAHYAIGILAFIMLASVKFHISEWFTGLSGVAFIGLSLWSSVRYKRNRNADAGALKSSQ
ncbi:MAG: DUF475 domain-containing protein [Glaciimonas sp.]|nr:DUF475 domain-containing protein [Glaciimonas sp.]